MQVWVLAVVLLVLSFAFSALTSYLRLRQLRSMTVSKFCDRFAELVKADRPDRLARFLQGHLGFIATHKDSIEQELAARNLLQRGSSVENKE